MISREEVEAWFRESGYNEEGEDDFLFSELSEQYVEGWVECAWQSWQASRAHESGLLAALKAITNSGPDAIPIKEAFEMAHRAIERVMREKV